MDKVNSNFFRRTLQTNYPSVVLSIVFLIIIITFVYQYVSRERFIYFDDYITYFNFYVELGSKFLHQPLKALDSISVSVRKAEYNNSGVIALVPFYFVFGAGRIGYITAIAVTYAFSISLFFPLLMKRIVNFEERGKLSERSLFFAVCVITLGFLPQFWVPVVLGYIDVAGVGAIFTILYLFFRKKLAAQSWKKLIVLGLLLSALIILRRWYAYWTVGFFAAVAVGEIWEFLRHERSFNKLKDSFLRIAVIGLSAVISFFALSSKIAVTMLKTDYRDEYSAFRTNENVFQAFGQLYSYFGLIFTLAAFGGALIMLARKDLRERGLFLSVIFVVTFFYFTHTQDIGVHHYYWVISILIIFASMVPVEILRRLKSERLKYGLISILTLVSLANFSIVFFPEAETALSSVSFALSSARIYPKIRNDLEQIHQLMLTLNSLTENSDKKIYVLSGSLRSNSGVLQSAAQQFEPELRILKDKIFRTSVVDKRDGFPFQLYEADYVIIADPINGSLPPDDQKTLTIPAGQIVNHQNIGKAYVKLPFEFVLDDGEKLFIYQRQRKFTREELLKMSEQITAFYPEKREKFAIDEEKLEKYSGE